MDVDDARKLIENATPGPWGVDDRLVLWKGRTVAECKAFVPPGAESNAAFIAAARTGWPEALDELVRLQAENEKLRKAPPWDVEAKLMFVLEDLRRECDAHERAEQEAARLRERVAELTEALREVQGAPSIEAAVGVADAVLVDSEE